MLLVLILFHLLLSNAFVESIKCDQIVKDPSQQEITISKKAAIEFSIDDTIIGELNLEDNPNLADDETYLEIVNRLPITETKMIHHHAQILEQFSDYNEASLYEAFTIEPTAEPSTEPTSEMSFPSTQVVPPSVDCNIPPSICNPDNMVCPLNFDPVCGCDGVTYGNACYARYDGCIKHWTAGRCPRSP